MITAQGLCKTFRTGKRVTRALENVSLAVKEGEGLVLSGKSGSGKTTLLHCIGGLERPDKGRVLHGETDLNALSSRALSRFIRENVGFVFQGSNLLSFLNVRENIAFPLELNGFGKAERNRRVDRLLDDIGTPRSRIGFPPGDFRR